MPSLTKKCTFTICFFIIFEAIVAQIDACDVVYPEVVVVNMTDEYILIKDISFNGCYWNSVLPYGRATSAGRCLAGKDRVHFKKFDAKSYCEKQVEYGKFDELCLCDGEQVIPENMNEENVITMEPLWFNYQTVKNFEVNYGEFIQIEIHLENIEQDFSTPGPYGH